MGTSTYDITSPGPADGSLSTQLDTAHLLEANTPDPPSNEEPLHLLPMPMPMPGLPSTPPDVCHTVRGLGAPNSAAPAARWLLQPLPYERDRALKT
ncbi:hypothetical protein ACJ73_09308, partial [Blastomyces percursus]